jgi:transposase
MLAIGLDVHAKTTMLAALDTTTGELFKPRRVKTPDVAAALLELPGAKRIALETGTQSMFLARQLKSCGLDVIVVDAFKTHRLMDAAHTAKTDRLDAAALARLLTKGALDDYAVWVPDERAQELRTLTRTRESLVEHRTALCAEVRAVLRGAGLEVPDTDLLARRAQARLDECHQQLAPLAQLSLAALRAALAETHAQVLALEAEIKREARQDPAAGRLMTITGCGAILALTILAEIGSLVRFADATHLRSYAGLTPAVHQSGERCFTGPLPRRGNPHLRRALVLLAQHIAWSGDLRQSRFMRPFYRLLHRRGPNPAKIALARRLCDVIFAMLRDGTEFQLERLGT